MTRNEMKKRRVQMHNQAYEEKQRRVAEAKEILRKQKQTQNELEQKLNEAIGDVDSD